MNLNNSGQHYNDIEVCRWVGISNFRYLYFFRSECYSLGGSLASIHSKEEDDFVFNLVQPRRGDDYGTTYLGATLVSGQHKWDDNTPWDYENWNRGDIYCLKAVSEGVKWTVFQEIVCTR